MEQALATTSSALTNHTAMLRFLLIIFFATLLLAAGVASAFEPPGGGRRGEPAYHAGQAQLQRREPAREQPREPLHHAAAPRPTLPTRGAEEAPPHEGPTAAERMATPQRNGRLSPEERRALRQQIDEAGRDVYRTPGAARP